MSQLRQTLSPSDTRSRPYELLSWPDFVQIVLELVTEACREFQHDQFVEQNWKEDKFTIRLCYEYIRPIALNNHLPIQAQYSVPVITSEILEGREEPKKANVMDLTLYDIANPESHTIHFVFEAKRVCDSRLNRKYKDLRAQYTKEGIYRFINLEYANALDDAGMLGYVLGGSVSDIVNQINSSMGKRLPPSNHLQPTSSLNGFGKIYQSTHERTDGTNIALHHLFLAFNFDTTLAAEAE